MTNLLNDKKVVEDSIHLAGNYERYWMDSAKAQERTGDTSKIKSLVDSSTHYYGRGLALQERLKAVNFSIDSLSKMK